MKKYIITNKNTIYVFKDLAIDTFLVMGFLCFLYYMTKDDMDLFVFLFLLIFVYYLCVLVIPVLYLYEHYERYNKGQVLILDRDKIIYNEEYILLSKITKVSIIATYQYFDDKRAGVATLPYSPYFYYIEIVADKKYYLTSLLGFSLGDDFQEFYPNLKYEKVISSYPTIKN